MKSPRRRADELPSTADRSVNRLAQTSGSDETKLFQTMPPIRVAIVSHIFHPDELGGAALMTDLALYLRDCGMEVKVASTFPYYPRWKLLPSDVGVWKRDDHFEGIPIRRSRMYVPHQASTNKRLLSDLSFLFSLSLFGRKAWRKADVIVTTCPMFGQTLAMRFATPFRSIPKLVIVQDFVVDAAIELGMIKNRFLGDVLKNVERWAFRSCSTLTTISEEMLAKLKNVVGTDRRTELIPNWIHGSLARAIDASRSEAKPRRERTLFYSGNVGRKQGLPDFMHVFDGAQCDWRIDINGSGAEFDELKLACGSRRDVVLQGLQDESRYIETLLTCSACLVTQKPGVGANFLPSKILPALATGTPILAVCEAQSPLGREVIEGECGAVVAPGDAAALHRTLQNWAKHPELLVHYGRNAGARARRYEREYVLSHYVAEIYRLAGVAQSEKHPEEVSEALMG